MSRWVLVRDLLWSRVANFFSFWKFKTVPFPDTLMSSLLRDQEEENMDSWGV